MQDAKNNGVSINGDATMVRGIFKIHVLVVAPVTQLMYGISLTAKTTCRMERMDAKSIMLEMVKTMVKFDSIRSCFNQIVFDRAINMQKAGLIIQFYFPQAPVTCGTKHVVSLIVGK